MTRERRKAVLDRVDKHDGHWLWTGTCDHRGRPVLPGGASARQEAWELWLGDPPGSIKPRCGEQHCLAPEHLGPGDLCPKGHDAPRTAHRSCKACIAEAASAPWVCACGKTMRYDSRHRHLRTCPGAPRAPAMSADDVVDALEDWRNGITPDRILRAYSTTPQALIRALYRRPELDSRTFRAALQREERVASTAAHLAA